MNPRGRSRVAVLLATRNRAQSLARTLESMCKLRADDLDWQLWVADNGSTDDSAKVLDAYSQRLPLHSVSVPQPGKNHALNQLLARADSQLYVFTDDDVEVDPDWLNAFVDAAEAQPGYRIFAGRIIPSFPDHAPEWIQDPEYEFSRAAFARFDYGDDSKPIDDEPFGPSFAVRADALGEESFNESVGPGGQLDYICGGETELLRRLRANGDAIYYVAGAQVFHHVRDEQLTERWLLGRALRLGRGHAHVNPVTAGTVNGVSIRLWRSLIWSWIRWKLTQVFGSELSAIRRGETFQHRLGQVIEYRRQSSASSPD